MFQATIQVFDQNHDQNLVWEAFFSTAEIAEKAIALRQAKIAPEQAWVSDDNGDASYFSPEGETYEAFIRKVPVFDSVEAEIEDEIQRIEKIKARLLANRC